MKDILYSSVLIVIGTFFFGACNTAKKAAKKAPPAAAVAAPVAKQYACSFRTGSFEGKIPCFGNDCEDNGTPVTFLQFREDDTVEKILGGNGGNRQYKGQWTIEEDCIITINYPETGKQEYYQLSGDRLIRLSPAKTTYGGNLKDQYILQRKN